MKKLIFSTILVALFTSCNKNENPEIQDTAVENSEKQQNTVAAPPLQFKEVNADELKKLVAPKNNDTLYVTNFFATWCGPCKREIPDFKEQMNSFKGKPVKFTFISLDERAEWSSELPKFAEQYGLEKNVIVFDAASATPDFFQNITKTWDGGSIPFTVMNKGNKTDETVGMLTQEELERKITSFK